MVHSDLDMHWTLSMGSVCQSTEIKGKQHTVLARYPKDMKEYVTFREHSHTFSVSFTDCVREFLA